MCVETILKFLYDHIDKCKHVSCVTRCDNTLIIDYTAVDLQARLKWQPGTVALWDNRITAHVSISSNRRTRNMCSYFLSLLSSTTGSPEKGDTASVSPLKQSVSLAV